jgi:hypothetical protein
VVRTLAKKPLAAAHLLIAYYRRMLRKPAFPEPSGFRPPNYEPAEKLATKFKDSGLQVIVKMASIELTPEKPEFPMGSWHVRSLAAYLLSEPHGTN